MECLFFENGTMCHGMTMSLEENACYFTTSYICWRCDLDLCKYMR
jgi:hypothetical protein